MGEVCSKSCDLVHANHSEVTEHQAGTTNQPTNKQTTWPTNKHVRHFGSAPLEHLCVNSEYRFGTQEVSQRRAKETQRAGLRQGLIKNQGQKHEGAKT